MDHADAQNLAKPPFMRICREFENWCDLRALSGKFLRQKSCYPFSLFVTLVFLYHHYHHRHLVTSNSLSPGTTSLPRLIQHSRRRPRVHEVVAALKVKIIISTINLLDLLILLKSSYQGSLYLYHYHNYIFI